MALITAHMFVIGVEGNYKPILILLGPIFVPNFVAEVILVICCSCKCRKISELLQDISTFQSDCCVPGMYIFLY